MGKQNEEQAYDAKFGAQRLKHELGVLFNQPPYLPLQHRFIFGRHISSLRGNRANGLDSHLIFVRRDVRIAEEAEADIDGVPKRMSA